MIPDIHQKAFIEEATELLSELEQTLLDLEENRDDKDLIGKVFRALHTIKGSSGMFGFDEMAHFTHDIENVYDLIRNGELPVTKEIIDLTLAARDQLYIMLGHDKSNFPLDGKKTEEILNESKKIIEEYHKSSGKKKAISELKPLPEVESTSCSEQKKSKSYNIHFKPSQNIFMGGTNPVLLLNELRDLGETRFITHTEAIPNLSELNPEFCYFCWDVVLTTDKGIDAINDVFIFLGDDSDLQIKECESLDPVTNSEITAKIPDTNKRDAISGNSTPELALDNENVSNPVENKADKNKSSAKKIKDNQDAHHEMDSASSLRVSTEKLDELVNLVSELVTIQARLVQIASQSDNTAIMAITEEVERITWELRDSALNIRMLPIGTTFSKFKRLVRDLSNELGKEVELTTEGAETELDKTVLEKLNDPLIHIIRNSIDHGIENPDERVKGDKTRMGTIKLSASQSGGNVLIKISDDGAGIDKEQIKAKAISSKLLAENSDASDADIFSMIFAPGFSTAKKVTSVSGRGVGMDVVKRSIESLRGSVEIESTLKKGTTISLKLPLTLAIIDGLLVKIAEETYVIPLSSVEECIELVQSDIEKVNGRHIVNIRGEIVPYIDIRERFGIIGIVPEIRQVVIADINGIRIGFMVDKVIGQHQTVLKTLGKAYKNVDGVSGATILGDGSVALILDITKLADKETYEESLTVGQLV
ncbi:MAG: chemotaxis protein CheA [Ignavibacteriaceae bacterium]